MRPRRRRVLGIACSASRAHTHTYAELVSITPAACLGESREAAAVREHNHDTPRKTLHRALARLTQNCKHIHSRAESSHVGCWGVRRASKAKTAHHARAIALRGEEAATGRADRPRAEACPRRAGRRHHCGASPVGVRTAGAAPSGRALMPLVGRARSHRSVSASHVAQLVPERRHLRSSRPGQRETSLGGGEETTGRL